MAQPILQQQPQAQALPEKAFPVSWDQFHRDARALAWRLRKAGPGRGGRPAPARFSASSA